MRRKKKAKIALDVLSESSDPELQNLFDQRREAEEALSAARKGYQEAKAAVSTAHAKMKQAEHDRDTADALFRQFHGYRHPTPEEQETLHMAIRAKDQANAEYEEKHSRFHAAKSAREEARHEVEAAEKALSDVNLALEAEAIHRQSLVVAATN